jgi:hypothetical protein
MAVLRAEQSFVLTVKFQPFLVILLPTEAQLAQVKDELQQKV